MSAGISSFRFSGPSTSNRESKRVLSWRYRDALILVFFLLVPIPIQAEMIEESALTSLETQLSAQASEIAELRARLDSNLAAGSSVAGPGSPLIGPAITPEADSSTKVSFYDEYDGGFVVRPFDSKKHPFELKTNAWIQFRHSAFTRNVETWTDNAGVTRPVRNRNDWDIERARLTFGGFALDRRLTYFLHLDGDTDGRHTVDFFDYWWAWKFSDHLRLQMGKRKVSASRQWLLGARRTRFIDRPMSNDFFRPDRTIGIWLSGQVGKSFNYELMVGNGYRTSNIPSSDTDNRFTFAWTNFWDSCGSYGGQVVDYDNSCTPLTRFGHSFVYSPVSGRAGQPLGESDFLRLTDGTRISQIGALAPGVTVTGGDIYFYGVDGAVKWRGWSMNAEVFLRWFERIQADGQLSTTDLFQRGFYVEGGCFLIPKVLDVNARYSQVSGVFANSSEYATGFNIYPLDTHKLKLSFDVTYVDGSPLNNTTSDILVGDDGVLFRSQFQAEF